MKTFKWVKGDIFGLTDLDPEVEADLRGTIAVFTDPDCPFYVGEGPWLTEPDKAFWVDDATGLDCMIHRAPGMGCLCGYVGVPKGHPLYGCDDWERIEEAVDAPRSINFAAGCQEGAPEAFGICHVPEPGRPSDVWWIGFDCGHFLDLNPVQAAFMRRMDTFRVPSDDSEHGFMLREIYRDFDCVTGYVTELAAELAGCAVTMRRAGEGQRSRHA